MIDRVNVSLPAWLFAGDTDAFMQAVGWNAISTSDPLAWQVALEEIVATGSRPMLTLHEILGPRDLVDIAEHPALVKAATRTINRAVDLSSLKQAELERVGRVAEIDSQQDLTTLMYVSDLIMMMSDENSFGLAVNDLMIRVRSEFPSAAPQRQSSSPRRIRF